MKKLILLLILPLTTLMAIDYTMTKEEGLFINTTTESPASVIPSETPLAGSNNPYLEPVNLPKCDANNPEVQFIRSNADWSTINSSKRIFCVSPADYTSIGNIQITASGTAEKRRYIVLNNGNDLHPGKLDKNKLANFALNLKAASYWTIDRAASFDVSMTHSFIVNKNSTYNIFNRMFTQNIFHTMWVRDKAHNNTIQNSRFHGITKTGAEADLATINVTEWGDSVKDLRVYGTKVINNEFVNAKAFRLNRFPESHLPSGVRQTADFVGSVFDSNTVEFNDAIRTDCKGNYTPTGKCMGLEAMALGTKSGSSDPSKPYIVSNNKVWGGLPSDPTFTKLSSVGGFINAYYGTRNLHILNNVVFNTTRGIGVADRQDMSRGTWDTVIKNNIIVNSGKRLNTKGQGYSMSISMAEGINVQNNLIKDPIGTWRVSWNMYNNFVGNNDIINHTGIFEYEGNWEPVDGIDTNNYLSTSQGDTIYTEDFTFTTDRFTNNPREITLENVIKPN